MSDDLDALLTRADAYAKDFWRSEMVNDLAAAVRDLRADYLAALDVIGRLTEGWDPAPGPGGDWYLEAILADNDDEPCTDPMSDREWRAYCDAAQRATHRSGT